MEKRLVYNAIRTPDGTVLVSYHRHDYKEYVDANGETYVIDGGTDYIRTSVNKEPAESLAIHSDEPYEKIRQFLCRGGRGKNGDEPLKYVPLKDIDDEWLQAIIDYEEKHRPENKYLPYYHKEQKWRQQ